MTGPDAAFWQERFEQGDTPWDRGAPGPQLLRWLDAGELMPCTIIVPGCGSGWEIAELSRRGFRVTGVDCATAACELSCARLQSIGAQADVVLDDVLTWRPPTPVDAVYEQTCLCALHPRHWRAYVASLAAWLRPGGVLLAMLAQRPRPGAVAEGLIEGPPYHTDIHAARALFDDDAWEWPAPPYPRVDHPNGMHELGLLVRRR